MKDTITILLFILMVSAIVGATGIAYLLSIAAERTTTTTVYSLAEATQVAGDCQGAHTVKMGYDEWVVTCRE